MPKRYLDAQVKLLQIDLKLIKRRYYYAKSITSLIFNYYNWWLVATYVTNQTFIGIDI